MILVILYILYRIFIYTTTMLVKDLVNNAIYRWTNQKLQTVLCWRTAIVSAINFSLDDIYTYEGKEWTFMYNKTIIRPDEYVDDKWNPLWDKNAQTEVITMNKPIKKIFIIEELDDKSEKVDLLRKPAIPPFPGPEWAIKLIEPTPGTEELRENELYFKPGTKQLYLPNNKNKGYVIHWISFFNPVDWEDEIPLPEHFMGCLYNITMTYLYPINWQYGDNKDANSYNKSMTQLVNLAKTDMFQINSVKGNIH